MSKRGKGRPRELTPEEKEKRQVMRLRRWENSVVMRIGVTPDRLETEMRRIADDANKLRRRQRQTVTETVAEIKQHQEDKP